MRKRVYIRAALAVLAALVLPVGAFALTGTVVYTEGDVTWQNGAQTHKVSIGDNVGAGDIITTGPASLAIIDLANSTTIKLKEKTTLAVDSIGDSTSVTLSAGAMFTSIARKLLGRFTVHTQSATAGVRGTEFFVAYGRTIDANPDVWLCVNEGTVEVSIPQSGQTVLVPKGRGINILGGNRITPPKAFAWTTKLNWNVDPSKGSVEDHTNIGQAYGDLLNQDYD